MWQITVVLHDNTHRNFTGVVKTVYAKVLTITVEDGKTYNFPYYNIRYWVVE